MLTQAEINKNIVKDVLQKALNEKDVHAAADHVADGYIQHSPEMPPGKAGFLQALPGFYVEFPDLHWELKHIWVDGDYVIAHSLYRFTKDGPGTAIVDIFRLEGGKLAEHWGVAQEIPTTMAHDNGMF